MKSPQTYMLVERCNVIARSILSELLSRTLKSWLEGERLKKKLASGVEKNFTEYNFSFLQLPPHHYCLINSASLQVLDNLRFTPFSNKSFSLLCIYFCVDFKPILWYFYVLFYMGWRAIVKYGKALKYTIIYYLFYLL